jgi:ATP-dependent Clp protease ATP-binding subunit ClpA
MASEIVFPTGLVHRKVGPGAVLAAPLFFPELSRLAANRELASEAVRRNLVAMLGKTPTDELIRCRRAGSARAFPFELVLDPPRASEAWRDPLTLVFHAVVWEHPAVEGHAPAAILARVAELGIEVIADPKADLTALLQKESLSALRRMNLSTGLRSLACVQNTTAFGVAWEELKVPVPGLKERAVKAEEEAGLNRRSVLRQVATFLNRKTLRPAFEADEPVRQTAEALTAKPPQSVLLIGPSGVGKTAVVREVARRREEFALGSTPFYQTSGARIVAGQTGFGMWEQRCQELIKEAAKARAILHVGPLVELMEVGKSEYNHTGIATFLRPAVARGELLCIAEATPEQLPLIEKQDPQLLDAFRHVTIEEPDAARGIAILRQYAEVNRRRILQPAALAALDRLHRRYATYSAYPGRPLRFLDNLLRDGPRDTAITEDEVYAGFTRETGLPRPLIDPAVPLDLAETHRWFASRVIGQPDAVNLVVDLLATVKAGLTRPNRPIASLLFIGPTGVGKTEMAKALAEFLFGSRDRMSRFDMSEYADPVSVRRLVGGAFGSEGLLTAKVREQPFSVLLLDEVEKADHSFFDLLLQALGEARLTDAGGRLADFRNTVIILTSNLGAESYRKGAAGFAGASPTRAEAQEHFTRAVEQFLRPEMFNRLDRVVPFAPLGSEVVRRIADREWHKVLVRDGIRFRGLTVNTSPELLDHLAAVGFDPRYGARPLKRAMERETIAPLARQFNRFTGDTPLSVEVGVAGGKPAVTVRQVPGAKPRSTREPTDPVGKFAIGVQRLRRWHQLVETSSVVRELHNEVYQLERVEARVLKWQKRGRRLTATDHEALAKLGRLREVAAEVERQRQATFALEDGAVIAFHEGAAQPPDELRQQFDAASTDWDKLLFRLYALTGPKSDSVTLALFSEHREHLAELAAAYKEVATRHNLLVEAVRYVLPGSEPPPGPLVPPIPARQAARNLSKPARSLRTGNVRPKDSDPPTGEFRVPETAWSEGRLFRMADNPPKELLWRLAVPYDRPLANFPQGTIGVGLVIAGTGAHVRFGGEAGLHKIVNPHTTDPANPDVLVKVSHEPLQAYRPPEKITRKGAIQDDEPRRVYELGDGKITDAHVDHTWTNLWGEWHERLDPVIAANVRLRLVRMVVE